MPLVRAVERQVQLVVGAREPLHADLLPADGEALRGEAERVALHRERGAAGVGGGLQHLERRRVLLGRDRRGAGLDDARLDGGDLGDRVPEAVGVVEVDRGEHHHVAVGGVGRIPRTAHPDLDNRDVDGRVGEGHESEHRQQLEEGEGRVARGGEFGVDEVDERRDLVPGIRDEPVVDRLAVDHDPLGEPLQVRAREQARAQTVGADDRLDDPRGRRLAVGAGEVHDPVGRLRVAEELQHPPGALDARLHPLLALTGEEGRVDGIRSRSIVHCAPPIRVTATVRSPRLA